MTVKELYDSIGGSYESAQRILPTEQLIGKFIVRFLDDTSCQRLLDASAGGDSKAIFEAAHSMKGVCANLGLNNLSEAAGVITEEFRPGKTPTLTPEELAQRMEALKADYGHAIEEIRKFAAAQQS